jgi:hypothetical protein
MCFAPSVQLKSCKALPFESSRVTSISAIYAPQHDKKCAVPGRVTPGHKGDLLP